MKDTLMVVTMADMTAQRKVENLVSIMDEKKVAPMDELKVANWAMRRA